MIPIFATLRPSFYEARIPGAAGQQVSLCRALLHLCALAALLSLPASLVCVARIYPLLGKLSANAELDRAERFFPNGIELVFNGSRAELRPTRESAAAGTAAAPAEVDEPEYACWERAGLSWCAELASDGTLRPIRLELPFAVSDLWFTNLPQPLSLPLAAFGAMLLGDDSSLLVDAYPNVNEYDVGERVQLRRKGWRGLFFGLDWADATVVYMIYS